MSTLRPVRNKGCQCGLSLPGLMIAMALSLLLSLGMVRIYLDNRRLETLAGELALVQDSARLASMLLRREIRMAGLFAGASGTEGLAPVGIGGDCAERDWALDTGWPLDLVDDFDGELLSRAGVRWTCLEAASVVPGSDILALKRSAGQPTLIDGRFAAGVSRAEATQWYLRVAARGAAPGWFYSPRGGRFPAADRVIDSGVEYWEFYARIFYLRSYAVEPGDAIPTLCVEQLSGNRMATDCLVEGVEDMQVEVGVDTDGDGVADRFLSAPGRGELSAARVLRVYLLLRGSQRLGGHRDNRRYRLGGKLTDPRGDAYHRRVTMLTVWLRNL